MFDENTVIYQCVIDCFIDWWNNRNLPHHSVQMTKKQKHNFYSYLFDAECLILTVRNGTNSFLNGNYHYAGMSSCPKEQPYFVSENGGHAIFMGLDMWILGWATAPKICSLGGYHGWPGESPWKPGPLNFNVACIQW